MLRRFAYLDRAALGEYVAALEGGLVKESTKRSMRSGSGGGGIDTKVAHASGERSREDEDTRVVSDTDEARFARLLAAADAEPEAIGWIEVAQPDVDLVGVGIGAMISWECDLYVPEIVQTMAKSGEMLKAIGMMRDIMPMASSLGLDTADMPDADEMQAVSGFLSGMNASLIVVGEGDDTEWRVAGPLNDQDIRAEIEGPARIVGKVSKVIAKGRWRPYMTFPGMNLGSREDRRRMERQPPAPGKEDEYLSGPALMLDILAVYR
jgi:hypothetical protein